MPDSWIGVRDPVLSIADMGSCVLGEKAVLRFSMKQKFLQVLRHYAETEEYHELEDIADALVLAAQPSFSQTIQIQPVGDQDFHGSTFEEKRDGKRLRSLQKAVETVMSDGQWRTLPEIHQIIGRGTETSIYARLNQAQYSGRFKKERKHIRNGLHQYRLIPSAA